MSTPTITHSWHLPHLPRPRSRAGRILRAVLPVLIIALGVYVLYNFPALKDRFLYFVDKPNPGNSQLLPPTTRTASTIPIGGPACGKPVSYDAAGNPTAICDNYIYIPKIKVAAPMVWPQSTSESVINADLLKGVVHYPGTAEPGQKGNVFLTGHSSYYWWVQSDYRNVFSLVPQLGMNDEIILYHKGTRYSYRVSELREVTANEVDVLRPTTEPVVTLSTCVPIGTSYRRKIVRAKQVQPDPATAANASSTDVTPGRLPGVR